MSFKKAHIYPPNPVTTRGQSIKLSSSKDKLIYTSGRTVIVRSSDLCVFILTHHLFFNKLRDLKV